MNYDFPIIETIHDVLPAIHGQSEFIIAYRDGFKVINYNVGYEHTFTIDENDLMENHGKFIPKGVMRRECRGLIFYPDGKLMSRPFHKFFNFNEREETQLRNIDMSQEHTIMEKMDGSMIRPIVVHGVIRLATKMGVTDCSIAAEEMVAAWPEAKRDLFAEYLKAVYHGMTPLFEFVSPENRIVLKYDQPDMVLLGIRRNRDGKYAPTTSEYYSKWIDHGFSVAPEHGSITGSLDEYIALHGADEGREGFIMKCANGQMYKGKNAWYVRIHKVKDKIRTDRHVLALLLANDLDDVYPHLDEIDYNYVKSYEAKFHAAMIDKVAHLNATVSTALSQAGGDKKKLAIEILPASGLIKHEYGIAFKMADGGHDLGDLVMKHVVASLGNTAKYNDLAAWLGIDADKGDDE
jgi:RNA ligase